MGRDFRRLQLQCDKVVIEIRARERWGFDRDELRNKIYMFVCIFPVILRVVCVCKTGRRIKYRVINSIDTSIGNCFSMTSIRVR